MKGRITFLTRNRTCLLLAPVLALILAGCLSNTQEEPSSSVPGPEISGTETQTSFPEAAEDMPLLQRQEIYREDGIVLTVTGIRDGFLGPEITVLIENNTPKSITVSTRSLSVNGYMMDTAGLYADVAPEKKANDVISFYREELDQAGIDALSEIAFTLHILDSGSHTTLADSPPVTLTTSLAGSHQQEPDHQGEVLYNQNGLRILSKGLQQDAIWDGTLVMYLENNSDLPVTVYTENVSINGFMVEDIMWQELRPGTRAIDGMAILSPEDTGIQKLEEVETMEFTFRIIHSDTWKEIATTGAIALSFQEQIN